MYDKDLIETSLGNEPADLIIKNGVIVNVYTKETYEGGVATRGNKIAAIGDVNYLEGGKVIDANGNYIVPGFIDAHIHPESSALSVPRFAQACLARGTTGVVTDFHEVGVVGGMKAIEACLDEGNKTPLKFHFVVPSHIPFSPGLETSGAKLEYGEIKKVLQRDESIGLSEVVDLAVLGGSEDLIKSINAAKRYRKVLDGHISSVSGPELSAYISTGIYNDHESTNLDEALERLRNGIHLLIREGSAAQDISNCIRIVTEKQVDPSRISLITDDTDPSDLVNDGHMDYKIKKVLKEGIDFVTAIQMTTLNPARSHRIDDEFGGLAPGKIADINIVTGPENFKVLKTVSDGELVAENNKVIYKVEVPKHESSLVKTFNLKKKVDIQDLIIPADGSEAEVLGMKQIEGALLNEPVIKRLKIENGYIRSSKKEDMIHIAVIERHHGTGNIGLGFVSNYGIMNGAIGSSLAHDNHNIVVMGSSPEDMVTAVNKIADHQGGQIVVENGKVTAEMPLPVLGLLSDENPYKLAIEKEKLLEKAKEIGCKINRPFLSLSFLTLAAIPAYRVTDKGFVDVAKQEIINPVKSVVS